jgi:hypothetical protein
MRPVFWMLVVAFVASAGLQPPTEAVAASCNQNDILYQDLFEWLSSGPDVLARTRDRMNHLSDSANIDAIVADYKSYFNQQNRAAPVAEIGLCNTVDLVAQIDRALMHVSSG